MYEIALDMLDEPARIKASLPLAYVVEKYGVALVAGEGRLHARCPFHDDSNPSFDIYPWGSGERWGCFGCGAGGDVLDFVQRMSGVGFREACEICLRGITQMQADGWKAPTLKAQFEWNEEAARDMMRRASTEGVDQIIAAKGWAFPASHLTATWNVRTMNGQLLVPVWDEHRSLVGIKHRPLNGQRSLISLPGSRLRTTLYGAEQLTYEQNVILCEGESDVWTASWALREIGHDNMAVLGLPAGAGAAPARLDLLKDRMVFLAFDGDDAGKMSAARWNEALGGRANVLPIPQGQDITSLGPEWLKGML